MISPLFFYQLVLIGLIWLFILLHLSGSSRNTVSQLRCAEGNPMPAKRKRRRAPKPVAGLTQRPPCPHCEAESAAVAVPPPIPPDPMPATNRRPRTVDTSKHFCPQGGCRYRGWRGMGNLRANGHPSGGPWRQFQCTSCKGYVLESHGTIFHGKRSDAERIVYVLACLAEGLGIRATARVFEVSPETVLQWLVEAAEQLRAFSAYFLCDVPVEQVQLDELYAVLSAVKDGEISQAKAIRRLSRSPHWLWVAIDPVSKLLLTLDVGPRTAAMAQHVLHQVVSVLAPDCIPLFLTDGYKEYFRAILSHFGHWVQPERRQAKGPRPKPRWMPLPKLLYAQVIKTTRRRRLVRITRRVVFGSQEAVERVLAAHGWQINTAFIERVNLSIRQHVAAVGRRVSTTCKGEAGLRDQLALYHAYYNFVLPHASLRLPLAEPMASDDTGAAKVWQPRTPAMAAGLTDHRWSLREVLMFRVPPWPQPQMAS